LNEKCPRGKSIQGKLTINGYGTLKAKGVYSKRLINFQGVILYMKLSTEQV
jgi:hypothetical protein